MSASQGIRAFLSLCFLPVVSFAQSGARPNPTASVGGQVLSTEDDRPIRHARVEFVSSSTGSGDSRLTDDKGQFTFEGLEQITYQVIASASGYQKLETTTQVQGKTGPLLLRLRKMELAASPLSNDVVSIQELKMSGKADKAFNEGTKLLIKGQIAQSVAYFNRAIAKDPSYYRAYHNLGVAQLLLGRIAQAEQALQKAVDLTGGGYAPTDFAMGMALCQQEDYRRAEQVIQKGLEIEPGSAVGRFYLAIAQFVLNRPVEAEKSAEQAISRRGDLAEAYILLAGIHQREQNAQAVQQDLLEYLHLQPNGPQGDRARNLLVRTQREMNKRTTFSGAVTQ